jgi:hypothetical protein
MKLSNIDTKKRSRRIVLSDYNSATDKNAELYFNGDVKACEEYTYSNQKEDAVKICEKFFETPIRAISIVKRTKVGMDGLMIEIAKNMTTNLIDDFVLYYKNVFFITAMSNKSWEDDLKNKMPACFKENVHHHNQLNKLKFTNLKNALIIIDEIDTGDKQHQKLHTILKRSGILDIKYMDENNIRFVFVSATIINELRDLYQWGDRHDTYYMTIPENYIGHKEFLDKNIIQNYYAINNKESAERWVKEDIIDNYGQDYRIHIIRTDEKKKIFISDACSRYSIKFYNHTSDDRITYKDLTNIFNETLNQHIVIAVKGFYRRANLIPNPWKLKIGACHEKYVRKYDTNVQVQGLPGRMSGYWKDVIENGHKTGPYRTSIDAIREYEEFYNNPFGKTKYCTTSNILFVNPKHIENLEIDETHKIKNKQPKIDKEIIIKRFKTMTEAKEYYNKELKDVKKGSGPKERKPITTNSGHTFYTTKVGNLKKNVCSWVEVLEHETLNDLKINGFRLHPCYENKNDNTTLAWIMFHY